MSALATWALAAMLFLVPHGIGHSFPGWSETPAELEARYTQIAIAVGEVAKTKSEAALLLALAYHESAFAQDVDVGPCYRGKRGGGWWSRCDAGTSYSVWQVKPYRKADGSLVTGATLQADRKVAARRALTLALGSLGLCRKLGPRDQLSAYIRGTCATGIAGSGARYDKWKQLESWQPTTSKTTP